MEKSEFRTGRKLKLIHVRITEEQHEAMDKLVWASAANRSDIIRLALTMYLNKMEDKEEENLSNR